jgi:hypothetical protein
MIVISWVLIMVVLFLIINGGTLANPIKWICNAALTVAILIYLYSTYGLPR